MKKILLSIMAVLFLVGCGTVNSEDKEDNNKELTIVTPLGAPVLAFYDQMENENYSRVQPNAIAALWTGNEAPDVIVCDLTSGVLAIEKGAEYKLGAIVTFGNLYIASTGLDDNDVMDKKDRIVLFGNENAIPSKVFHYLYGEEFDECLIYENSASEAAAALATGKASTGEEVDYVFLAQPALFGSLKKAKDGERNAEIVVDIQKEYYEKSGMEFVQAALFINNSVSEEDARNFLRNLEISINAGLENPDYISKGLSVFEGDEALVQYGFNPEVVMNVLKMKNGLDNNAMGLGYKKACSVKNEIDTMLSLFNIDTSNEEMYIK